jgi:hypothetical protein
MAEANDDKAKAENILKNALLREEELRKEFEASEGDADAVENIFSHAAENEQAMRAQLETLSIDAAEADAIIKTAVLSSPSNKPVETKEDPGKPAGGLPYLSSPQKPIAEIKEHLEQIENLWEHDAEEMTKISLAMSFVHYVLFNQEGGGAVALKAWHVMTHGTAWQKCYILVLTSTGFFQIQSDSNLHSAQDIKYEAVNMESLVHVSLEKTSTGGYIMTIGVDDKQDLQLALDTPFYLRPDESQRCTGDMVTAFQAVHRRFLTAPENIEHITPDIVRQLSDGGGKAQPDADDEA